MGMLSRLYWLGSKDVARRTCSGDMPKVIARQISRMRAITVNPSDHSMSITDVDAPHSVPPENVVIKVHATALNRADLLQRVGKYPPPVGESDIIGLEVAGTVAHVGSSSSKWKEGDRVMALLAGGGYAEYVSVNGSLCCHMPNSLSMTSAAAIPEAWMTAYQLIKCVGQSKEGESVLIHAGGSGVGTAAIQLAQLFKLNTFVTVGSTDKEKIAKLLGANHVINYRDKEFGDVITQLTEGTGVDLILDCVGNPFASGNLQSLAVDGRWVVYGFMGGPIKFMPNLFKKRASIHTTTLRTRTNQYKSDLVSSFQRDALPYFGGCQLDLSREGGQEVYIKQRKQKREGIFNKGFHLQPVIDSVYSWQEVETAMERMKQNLNTGKIVLEVHKEDKT